MEGGAERAQAQRIDFQSLIDGGLQKARLKYNIFYKNLFIRT